MTLVAVEGIDGAGKSSLASNVVERLSSQGVSAVLLRPLAAEPGFLEALQAVHRRLIPEPELAARKEGFLAAYFGYRLVLAAEADIWPALAAGQIAVCDRYLGSHRVNQAGFGQDLTAYEPVFQALPAAAVLYLRVPVAVAMARLRGRVKAGAGDRSEFLEAASARFDALAAAEGWTVLDGTLPELDVLEAALGALGYACSPVGVRR